MSFVHLRVHSEFSFLHGACRLEELVLRAKELGMPAVALTDYGVLHGAARFTELALQHNIKPILGVELQLNTGLPIVLLVKNKTGWSNLLRLVNSYHLAQPASKKLELSTLVRYGNGLILVVHSRGEGVSWQGNSFLPLVEETLRTLRPLYTDDFYLALENAGLPGEERLNVQLAALAQKLQLPLLATQNVHYLHADDEPLYRMVNCIRTGKPLAGACHYFLPRGAYDLSAPTVMRRRFADYLQACDNTLQVAERCHFILRREGMHLPAVELPGGESAESALRRFCREGMQGRGLVGEKAKQRLERELAVILSKGLAAYFLIVHDLVNHARAVGIPVGPGRGSAGGSLVTYLLGITQVNPLAHGLYFERFLSEDRTDFPDIDIDVCQRRREELLDYLRKRYGAGRVVQVSTFSTLGARAAVREVGKMLDISSNKITAVAEALPHYAGRGGIEAAIRQFPEFQQNYLRDRAAQQILEKARRLEGLCRHLSTHASGVILGVTDLTGVLPLCYGPAGEILSQWDKDDVESMGFLKIDILGSRNLTIIHDTLASVAVSRGNAPAVEEIPLDDAETFKMLQQGDSLGCFQLESAGMRRVLKILRPECLEDLIHLLSLYRPGPWESGMVETFVSRRRGQEKTDYLHPLLADILKDTYGVILYQEQVMRIACEVGGFSAGKADCLRRAMGKRSAVVEEIFRPQFISGARQKGLSKSEAETVFNYLCRFAGYGFNKAHSAAYALVSYWTAYLKKHYPVEFYAALLSAGFGYYGSVVYIHEARRRGIKFLPPHVNHSGPTFLPEGKAIRVALSVVRELGSRSVAAVIRAREQGPYCSLHDFCQRLGRSTLRRSALVNLIKVGAFEGLGLNRRQALAMLDYVLKWTDRQPGQLSFWSYLPEEKDIPALADFNAQEVAAADEEILGFSLLCHPLHFYQEQLEGVKCLPLKELPTLPAGQEVSVAAFVMARSRRRLKQGGVMLTLFLSDESGFAEAIFYPAAYRRLLYCLKEKALFLRGKTTEDGDALIVQQALPLALLPGKQENKTSVLNK
ncbi:MAG: DNA polymerase III subunit alpha [Firmicutes bacterium]|nr:DNA polymerase III subunit alpha [Bacillota bacterium]